MNGHKIKWWILVNVCIGTFMANLDSSSSSVALPTISEAFGVSVSVVQWVVTGYLLTICALLPMAGKLADQWGLGRLYYIGFFVFALGSAFSAMSVSIGMLIAAKVFQGIGSALMMANAQGIIAVTFGPAERGRAMGITGISVSLGALSGPALGGFLIEHFHWSAIFWINVPIGLIGFATGLRIFPKERPKGAKGPFDLAGLALFAVGVTILLYSVSSAETTGWFNWPIMGGIAGALAVLWIFYRHEKRLADPMIDFSLYRNRRFSMAIAAGGLSMMALYFITIMMPFYLQHAIGAPPKVTGYVMAAYPAAMALSAPLSGWLSDRVGRYALTIGGLLLNAFGFLVLSFLSAETSFWLIAANLALFGIGHGMFQPVNNADLLESVPQSKVGQAGGLNALTRNFGMMFGASLSVSIYAFRLQAFSGDTASAAGLPKEALLTAFRDVFWVAAAICIIAAVFSSMRGKAKAEGDSGQTTRQVNRNIT